jgi:hypothetical protein
MLWKALAHLSLFLLRPGRSQEAKEESPSNQVNGLVRSVKVFVTSPGYFQKPSGETWEGPLLPAACFLSGVSGS